MANRSNRLPWVLAIVIIGAGLTAALWWRSAAFVAEPALTTGAMLSPRRELPDFNLIDHQGRAFAPANLRGAWSLLFFGYTNCPDVCPATLATLATVEKRLHAAGDKVRPRVVFISVDAGRDTPAQLARYVPYFDPEFVGATAKDQRAIESVARDFGVVVLLTPRKDGTYSVDHSSAIFVVDPVGKIAAILTGPFAPDTLQDDFRRIVASAS
jgi:protein SCO1/2